MAHRRAAALALLALLVWCPLASTGVLTPCHGGEEAMDCCQPQEGSGSGAPGPTGTKAPATHLPSQAVSPAALADATPMWTGRPSDSLELHVPLHTLHSVFRI
jgi:hypothetical protein